MSTADQATAAATWLTQDAFDRLSRELDGLIANRAVIAKEINDRRDEGDLRENGGYHAAREEQAKQEGRILQLQQLLRDAQVGDAPVSDGTAGPGMVVTVRFGDDEDIETFLIGSREEAETAGRRGLLRGLPAGRGPDRCPRGGDGELRDADRQDHAGDAGQRPAVSRLRLTGVTRTSSCTGARTGSRRPDRSRASTAATGPPARTCSDRRTAAGAAPR